MAAKISSLLLLTLLAVGAFGLPFKFGGDFGVGGTSRTNVHAGLGGELGLKGKALSGTVSGTAGASVDGAAKGGAHAFVNDAEIGAGGVLNGNLGVELDHTHNAVIGLSPGGKLIAAGSSDVTKTLNANLSGSGMVATGAESRALTDAVSLNDIVHGNTRRQPIW